MRSSGPPFRPHNHKDSCFIHRCHFRVSDSEHSNSNGNLKTGLPQSHSTATVTGHKEPPCATQPQSTAPQVTSAPFKCHDAPWAMLAAPAPMTSYTFGKQMSLFGGEHDNGCILPRLLVL